MDRLLRLGGVGLGQNSTPTDAPVVDTAEQVYISSLALLKMLKHGRAGKPQIHSKIIPQLHYLFYRCSHGGHGFDVGRVRRRLYRSR